MTLFDYPLWKARQDVLAAREARDRASRRCDTKGYNRAQKALEWAVAALMKAETL